MGLELHSGEGQDNAGTRLAELGAKNRGLPPTASEDLRSAVKG